MNTRKKVELAPVDDHPTNQLGALTVASPLSRYCTTKDRLHHMATSPGVLNQPHAVAFLVRLQLPRAQASASPHLLHLPLTHAGRSVTSTCRFRCPESAAEDRKPALAGEKPRISSAHSQSHSRLPEGPPDRKREPRQPVSTSSALLSQSHALNSSLGRRSLGRSRLSVPAPVQPVHGRQLAFKYS